MRRTAMRAVRASRVVAPQLHATTRAVRRATFITRVKLAAAWAGGRVRVDIAPDADIHSDVVIEVWGGTHSTLTIESGASIGDRVKLSLRGGQMHVGAGTEVRRFGTYHISGRLGVGADCLLSTGICIHCADDITVGDMSIISEYSTVSDSIHERTPPGDPVRHATSTKPVVIGRNVWIAPHVVITRGVTVGDQAFVGAGSVVMQDVPPGWLAAGVPARAIRELETES